MKSCLYIVLFFTIPIIAFGQCPSSGTSVNLTGTITITSADSPCVFSADDVTSDATIIIEQGASMTVNMTGLGSSIFDQFGGSITVEGDGTGGDEGVFTIAGDGDLSLQDATLNIGDGAVVNIDRNLVQGSFLTSTLNIEGALNIGNNYELGSASIVTGSGHIEVTNSIIDSGVDESGFTGTANCGGGCEPLPVTLSSFELSAHPEYILLDWVTSSEINNEGFEIEKSYDGQNFEFIEFVEGNGTTNTKCSYSFEDYSITESTVYYRLKQIDYDGQYEYSETKSIRLNSMALENQKMTIYPSHVTQNIINIKGYDEDEMYMTAIIDISGQQYFTTNEAIRMSEIVTHINRILFTLPKSIYIIRIESPKGSQVLRFIKE